MPLRTEIEAVSDRAIRRLTDAHDYYTFTESSWETVRQLVRNGTATVRYTNPATGTVIDGGQFAERTQRYRAEELASATLQQFVSIFESFLFDVPRLWLLAYPQSLGKRQLSGDDILALPDKAAIVDALVVKELATVLYDRPANWFRYLNERVGVDVPADDARQFAEVKATRDVLVHGTGVANESYISKVGPAARAEPGQPLDVPSPYHHQSWRLIGRMIGDVGTAMAAKG